MNDNSGNIATGPYSSTHDVVPEDMLIVEWCVAIIICFILFYFIH